MKIDIALIVIGAGLVTYSTRFPLMILSGKIKIPVWLEKYLSYIAPAVLTALIVPVIFIKQGKLDFSLTNEYIAAAVLTAIVAYFSKNMLVSVICGILTVAVLSYLM